MAVMDELTGENRIPGAAGNRPIRGAVPIIPGAAGNVPVGIRGPIPGAAGNVPIGITGIIPGAATPTRQVLDAIVADYTARNGIPSARRASSELRQRVLGAPAEQGPTMDPLDLLNLDYNNLLDRPEAWQTVGGPNQGIISALTAQRQQLQQNYATNKADANNLYGILSSDIEEYGAGLQTRYGESQASMSAAETARTDALVAEQAAQRANRAAAAAELGLGMESLQMAPDQTINELMATNAGAASNWANFFEANRLREDASTGRQMAGATATKNQQLIAMKNFLDQQQAAVDQQIMMERSKSPTRQLTEIGKVLQDAALGAYEDYLNPEDAPLYSANPIIARRQQAFESESRSMDNPADMKWYSDTYNSIVSKLNNAKAGVSPGLSKDEKRFMQAFQISGVGLGIVDPNLLYE